MTDHEILAQYASTGSEQAFAEIVRRYSATVHSACLRILGESNAAADATQATFMVLARKARKLSPRTILSGWLYLTARTSAQKLRRAERRRARHEREAAMERTDAQESVSWERLSPELDAAMASLPTKQRNAIILRYFQDRPEREVAAEMGLPQGTVSKWIESS